MRANNQQKLVGLLLLVVVTVLSAASQADACSQADYIDFTAIVSKYVTVAPSGVYHYNGLDNARAQNVETNIIYIVQNCDGGVLKVYVGQTINSFKKRYGSNSAMSTGLRDVIDDVRDPVAGVNIYKVTSSLDRTPGGYPDELIANDVLAFMKKNKLGTVTNVRGMGFREVMSAGSGAEDKMASQNGAPKEIKVEGLREGPGVIEANDVQKLVNKKGKFFLEAVSCDGLSQYKCRKYVNAKKERCKWNTNENQCRSAKNENKGAKKSKLFF